MGKFGNRGKGGQKSNGNGPQKKWCNHCKKDNHNTNDCFKKNNGPQNHDNKVTKHQKKEHRKNGRDSDNRSQSSNQHQHNREPCMRCGLRGHELKNCNAKEVPDDQRCECENDFHRNNQCPWGNDPIKREEAVDQATGKICRWCKDASDGTHTFEQCDAPGKFKSELLRSIRNAYDQFKWCWHCSADDHITRACPKLSAQQDKARWEAKITDITTQWLDFDHIDYDVRYRDNDEDILMTTAQKGMRPPLPSQYQWCAVCEEFGHIWDDGTKQCKYHEYERRCPLKLKGQAAAPLQPFVPAGFVKSAGSVTATNNAVACGAHARYTACVTPGCITKVGEWLYPPPAWTQKIKCGKCGVTNKHPHAPRQNSTVEALKYMSEILGIHKQTLETGKKTKKNILEDIKDPYKKRPSLLVSKKVAVHRWPITQPRYFDPNLALGKEPIYKNDGEYFNQPGNHQLYFPAYKFAISEEMEQVALYDELWVNKAGRLGLRLQCLNCKMQALVRDEEGDYVMCGTHSMNNVGVGMGEPFWCDEYGCPRPTCRCLPILGQTPNIAWVTPRV